MARQRGSALVMTVLALPVLVGLLFLIAGAGSLYVSRGALQSVVDMAALAGVQELDWDRLTDGEIVLIPHRALDEALANLAANIGGIPRADVTRAEITVRITNADPEAPLPHPGSGRLLHYPTVWVLVRVPVRPAGAPGGMDVWLWATADASVEPRR